jgi:hypothetical protein
MDPINSNTMTEPQLYAMKKAMDIQGQGLMKMLDSAQALTESSNQTSGSSLTGIGQTLDLRA